MSLGPRDIVTRPTASRRLDSDSEQADAACVAESPMEHDMKTTELIKLCIAIATVMVGVTAYTLLIAVQAAAV